MIPASFAYAAPTTLKEAIALLAKHGEEAKALAGGHSLLPMMKLRLAQPALLVDLGKIPGLDAIETDGGSLRIGAMATHTAVALSELLAARCPLLPEAARQIGDAQVRNRGTIGGSLAHADPAADYPAVVLALDATVTARGSKGEREVPAGELFTGLLTTSLQPDEIITEIRVPALAAGTGSAYVKFPNPASHYAVVGIAAVLRVEGGTIAEARVGVTGAADTAYRAAATEAKLQGAPATEESCREAAVLAAEGAEMLSDLAASEEYRAHLTRVYAARALRQALERA